MRTIIQFDITEFLNPRHVWPKTDNTTGYEGDVILLIIFTHEFSRSFFF